MENIGQPRYGIINSGLFGSRIISGIITGIRYTEDKPIYEISFGKDKWETSKIFDNIDDLTKTLELDIAPLSRVKATHGLKIKFEK
jgi:hypothetical protein